MQVPLCSSVEGIIGWTRLPFLPNYSPIILEGMRGNLTRNIDILPSCAVRESKMPRLQHGCNRPGVWFNDLPNLTACWTYHFRKAFPRSPTKKNQRPRWLVKIQSLASSIGHATIGVEVTQIVRHNLSPDSNTIIDRTIYCQGGWSADDTKVETITEPLVTLRCKRCYHEWGLPCATTSSVQMSAIIWIRSFLQGQKTTRVTMKLPCEPHQGQCYLQVVYYLPAVFFLLVFTSLLCFRSLLIDHVWVWIFASFCGRNGGGWEIRSSSQEIIRKCDVSRIRWITFVYCIYRVRCRNFKNWERPA